MRMVLLAGAVVLAASASLVAHHSFAAFDRTKEVTLEGVVTAFQFDNPHAWIEIDVVDGKGRKTGWALEGGSPNMMRRNGWKRTTLKAGDRVVAVGNPLKDGRPNAILVRITVPDGRTLGPGDAPPRLPVKR